MAFQVIMIIAGLVAGWIRRGSLWNIANLKLRMWWILPFAYLFQHISISYTTGLAYEILIVLSYLSMVAFCIINLRMPGLRWALAGTLSNLVALAANGLRMPAYIPAIKVMAPQILPQLEAGTFGKSIAMSSSTHLNFLCDIFSFYPKSIVSVGDVLFAIGLVLVIYNAMQVGEKGSTANA